MPSRIEPVLLLLAFLVVLFAGALFVSERMFPQDGQIFQVISGLTTGFAGALLLRVKPQRQGDDPVIPPPGTTIETSETASARTEPK